MSTNVVFMFKGHNNIFYQAKNVNIVVAVAQAAPVLFDDVEPRNSTYTALAEQFMAGALRRKSDRESPDNISLWDILGAECYSDVKPVLGCLCWGDVEDGANVIAALNKG